MDSINWFSALTPFFLILITLGVLAIGFQFLSGYIRRELKANQKRKKFRDNTDWLENRRTLNQLHDLHPTEFEYFIADLFTNLGYSTEQVGKSHDGGIDVIAEKDGVKHYIQCKKFISREVSVGAVRDFYGALADHLANAQGLFITTNKFTFEAKKYAEDKPIELIDGFRLLEYMKLAEQKNDAKYEFGKSTEPISPQNNIQEQTVDNIAIQNKCPRCGGNLVLRESEFGKFYGCSNFPKCWYKKTI